MRRNDILALILPAVLFSAPAGFSASPEGAGRERLDRQTGRLSANLLLSDWRSRFASPKFPAGTERIYQEMKRDPAGNSAVEPARRNAAGWFREELKARYREEAARVLKPFETLLDEAVLEQMRRGNEAFFEKRFSELFPGSFAEARKRLAEEQRKAVFARVYPTAEEVEKFDDEALAKMLEERFRARLREPLMEENVPLLQTEVIAPVIAAGRAQQTLQLKLLARQTIPAELWDEEAVRKNLIRSVEKAVEAEVPEAERFALFPKTLAEISRRAAQLPVERTVDALPDGVELDFYRELLRREPEPHREPETSFRLVAGDVQSRMILEAMDKVGFSPEQRKPIQENPAVIAAAEQRFREKIIPAMKEIRREVAEEELNAFWPALVDGKWIPEHEEIEAFAASGSQTVPELASRPADVPLLREAAEKLDRMIRKTLASGVAVLEKQRQAISDVYDTVINEMRRKQYSGRRSWLAEWFGLEEERVSFGEIRERYRELVRDSGEGEKGLFPTVEEEIDVRARAILQELQEMAEAKQREKSSTEELPLIQYTVRLEENRGRVIVRLGSWSASKRAAETGKLWEELQEELRRCMAEVAAPARFEIRILVNGERILYVQVAELRDRIREVVGEGAPVSDACGRDGEILSAPSAPAADADK